MIIYRDQVGFIPEIQGFFNMCKSMWYIILTNWRIKTISIDAEKAFDKILHRFMIKKKKDKTLESGHRENPPQDNKSHI